MKTLWPHNDVTNDVCPGIGKVLPRLTKTRMCCPSHDVSLSLAEHLEQHSGAKQTGVRERSADICSRFVGRLCKQAFDSYFVLTFAHLRIAVATSSHPGSAISQ